jgi:hypothetical protein
MSPQNKDQCMFSNKAGPFTGCGCLSVARQRRITQLKRIGIVFIAS